MFKNIIEGVPFLPSFTRTILGDRFLRVSTLLFVAHTVNNLFHFLFQVTINGADPTGDWDRLIQPLDRGSFDVSLVLKELRRIGYTGPIGLQCYNIAEDKSQHLSRSIAAWNRLVGGRLVDDEHHGRAATDTRSTPRRDGPR